MKETLERLYRFVLPGATLAAFLAPLWWLIGPARNPEIAQLSVLGGALLGYGALYHLFQKRILEAAIDRAWKAPCLPSWDEELLNWPATSWLLPGAKLGYRLRRMKFLVEASKTYQSLTTKVSPGQARGYVDASSYTWNPDLKHKVRLAYFYSELGIIINGLLSAVVYLLAGARLVLHGGGLGRITASFSLTVVLVCVAYYFRHVAADEIERVESVQHALSVESDDADWRVFSKLLDTLNSDLEVLAGETPREASTGGGTAQLTDESMP